MLYSGTQEVVEAAKDIREVAESPLFNWQMLLVWYGVPLDVERNNHGD